MAVALFSYTRGTTCVHKAPVLLKLALLYVISARVFAVEKELVFYAVLVAVLFALARIPFVQLKNLRLVIVAGLLLTVFRMLCLPPKVAQDAVYTVLPFLAVNRNEAVAGLLYTVRFFIASAAAQVLFSTSSSMQLQEGLESLQNLVFCLVPPLKKYNPVQVISLAIGFIPKIFSNWEKIKIAALSRSPKRRTIRCASRFGRRRTRSGRAKNTLRPVLAFYSIIAQLSALFSIMLYSAEITRKAVLNRTARRFCP